MIATPTCATHRIIISSLFPAAVLTVAINYFISQKTLYTGNNTESWADTAKKIMSHYTAFFVAITIPRLLIQKMHQEKLQIIRQSEDQHAIQRFICDEAQERMKIVDAHQSDANALAQRIQGVFFTIAIFQLKLDEARIRGKICEEYRSSWLIMIIIPKQQFNLQYIEALNRTKIINEYPHPDISRLFTVGSKLFDASNFDKGKKLLRFMDEHKTKKEGVERQDQYFQEYYRNIYHDVSRSRISGSDYEEAKRILDDQMRQLRIGLQTAERNKEMAFQAFI